MLNKVHLSNVKVCMIILLLMLVALIVRVYPFLPYDIVPGEDFVNHIFPVLHILETGHELVPGEIETYGHTSAIYGALNDRTKNMLPAITAIIFGLDEYQHFIFERFFLFISVVVFPFCILSLYSYLCRQNGRRRSNNELVLLFAAATFGNYLMITVTNSQSQANINSVVWSFMVLAFYSLLRSKQNANFSILFILFTICITSLHRTAAMFFLCVLAMMLVWKGILLMRQKHEDSQLYTSGAMLTGIIIIFAYYLYVGKDFFNIAVLMAADIRSLLGAHGPHMLHQYLMQSTPGMQIFMAANIIASALSVVYFSIYLLRRKYDYIGGYQVSMTWLPWMLTLVPFSGGMFIWAGLHGVFGRTNLYAVVVYLTALAIILSSLKRSSASIRWVKVFLVIAILSSVPLYTMPGSPPVNHLTHSEAAASKWLMHSLDNKDVIFTDYRLAGPFTLSGFMRTTTALGGAPQHEPVLAIGNLEAIYYSEEDVHAALARINKQRFKDYPPNYLFFSRWATEVGIKDVMFACFKPPPEGFLKKFDKAPYINKVYDNGTAIVYSWGEPPKLDTLG